MADYRVKIGITQGDTNGIGWEVILKAFADSTILELFTPVIYGSRHAAQYYAERIEGLELPSFHICQSAQSARHGALNLVEVGERELPIKVGQVTREGALAAQAALEAASADLAAGALAAVVTAPINKEAMMAADFGFIGHTEYFESKFEGESMMIMCSDMLRVALATVHIPVGEVASALSTEKIAKQLSALRQTLKADFGIVEPRIAVLSLNPHAGDGGALGNEEQEIIKPAILQAYEEGVLAFGPLSADGLFAGGGYAKYDAVLAMYHDQGLTPFKALSPDGVNFTAGLSIVRTSPDHGTAYDIAGRGVADAQSMRNAIYMALDTVRRRRRYAEWSRNPLERFERDKGRDVSAKDLAEIEVKD